MEEKKEKKEITIGLGTLIVGIVIVLLLVVIGIMAVYIINQNKEIETSKIAIQSKEKELQNKIETEMNTISINSNNIQQENQENIITKTNGEADIEKNNENNITTTTNQSSNNNLSEEKKTLAKNNDERKRYVLETASTHIGNILSNDIDFNANLYIKIDDTKSVKNVTNYASMMNWSTKSDSDYYFKYPSNWTLQQINNGIERYRISGKEFGKIATDSGNGDKAVEFNMEFVIYEPVIFNEEDMSKVTWKDDGTNGAGQSNADGFWWTQVYLNGKNAIAENYYAFIDNNDGTKKLLKFRILTPNNTEISSYKVINIINYFIGEFRPQK